VNEFLSVSGASAALAAAATSHETTSPQWVCITSEAGASSALSSSMTREPSKIKVCAEDGDGDSGKRNSGASNNSNGSRSSGTVEQSELSFELFKTALHGDDILELVVPSSVTSLAAMLALLENDNAPVDGQPAESTVVTTVTIPKTPTTQSAASTATKAREAVTSLASVLPSEASQALKIGTPPVIMHLPTRRIAWPLPPRFHYELLTRTVDRSNLPLDSDEIVGSSTSGSSNTGSNSSSGKSTEIIEINDKNLNPDNWYREYCGGLSPIGVSSELQHFVAAIEKREHLATKRYAAAMAGCEEAASAAAATAAANASANADTAAATKVEYPPIEAAAAAASEATTEKAPENFHVVDVNNASRLLTQSSTADQHHHHHHPRHPSAPSPSPLNSKSILPPLLVKYRKFLANRDAETKPGMRWCPTPGCETALVPTLHPKKKMPKQKNTRARAPSSSHSSHTPGEVEADASASDIDVTEDSPHGGDGGSIGQLFWLPLQRLKLFAKAFTSSSASTTPAAVVVVSAESSSRANCGSSKRLRRGTSRPTDKSRRRKQGRDDCWRVVCCAAKCSVRGISNALRVVLRSAAMATGADLVASRTMPAPELTCPSCAADVCSRCGRPAHRYSTSRAATAAASNTSNNSSGDKSGDSSISNARSGTQSRQDRLLTYLARSGCEEAVDETLAAYRKEKHLQPCPACCRQVEKIDACPHMSCPCGHQWCWVCRGNFPCANLHFGKSGQGSSEEIGDVTGVREMVHSCILGISRIYILFLHLFFFYLVPCAHANATCH